MKQLSKTNHKGGMMKQIVAMMIAGVMLTGCYATTGTVSKQDVSTGVGCVAGGVAGSKIGSGSGKTAATILGTLAGGKVGSEVGKNIENN
jgi:outer membrane lipoprotein SlyB